MMKVKFFSEPYLLYVGNLPPPGVISLLSGKHLRIHVVGWVRKELGQRAIAVLGWKDYDES